MTFNTQHTILLVEDDPNDVLLIRYAFRQAQLTTSLQVATNGVEAIDYLAGKGVYANRQQYPLPICILLDLKLPLKTGFEVLAWVRQQPTIRRVPIIILTSSKVDRDIDKAYDLGANSYLVKPVKREALHDLMKLIENYWVSTNEKPLN